MRKPHSENTAKNHGICACQVGQPVHAAWVLQPSTIGDLMQCAIGRSGQTNLMHAVCVL